MIVQHWIDGQWVEALRVLTLRGALAAIYAERGPAPAMRVVDDAGTVHVYSARRGGAAGLADDPEWSPADASMHTAGDFPVTCAVCDYPVAPGRRYLRWAWGAAEGGAQVLRAHVDCYDLASEHPWPQVLCEYDSDAQIAAAIARCEDPDVAGRLRGLLRERSVDRADHVADDHPGEVSRG